MSEPMLKTFVRNFDEHYCCHHSEMHTFEEAMVMERLDDFHTQVNYAEVIKVIDLCCT